MKKIKILTQITNLLISLLRGTPVIVQLYVAFFGIPLCFLYVWPLLLRGAAATI